MRLIARQELGLDPEILVLLEGMPVLEVDIGAPAVAQRQDEPRRALVQVAERPEALDALYVAAREAVKIGVEDMKHVAELVDSFDPE